MYSTPKAHLQASGPAKWNKQQGLYIYRSNRIIQSGGWSGLRTSDEHTKLVRIALTIPSQIEELFQVNVAKKLATLPRELRQALQTALVPIIHRAQTTYREKGNEFLVDGSMPSIEKRADKIPHSLIDRLAQKSGCSNDSKNIFNLMNSVYQGVSQEDAKIFLRVLEKYLKN